jgi:hypothetical protein
MERFGATEDGLRIANPMENMVGTRRLELLTSTVSKIWQVGSGPNRGGSAHGIGLP